MDPQKALWKHPQRTSSLLPQGILGPTDVNEVDHEEPKVASGDSQNGFAVEYCALDYASLQSTRRVTVRTNLGTTDLK